MCVRNFFFLPLLVFCVIIINGVFSHAFDYCLIMFGFFCFCLIFHFSTIPRIAIILSFLLKEQLQHNICVCVCGCVSTTFYCDCKFSLTDNTVLSWMPLKCNVTCDFVWNCLVCEWSARCVCVFVMEFNYLQLSVENYPVTIICVGDVRGRETNPHTERITD